AEVEYKEKTDESLYLVFHSNIGNVLVWTTTPWTLPANVAIAMNPNLKYCLATLKKSCNSESACWVAEDCFEELKRKGIVDDIFLESFSYEHFVFKHSQHPIYLDQQVPFVAADFVTADKGTGFVHIAPGHGEEDYLVALKNNLPIVVPVGPDGIFTEGKYKGTHIFEKGSFVSNPKIIEDLKETGNFVCSETITHSYPYCSRSNTPLIFRATEQWFLDLDKIRSSFDLQKELDNVEFYPENSKNRLLSMVQNRPDWCISRQRLWGVPLFDNGVLDVWFDSGLSWGILSDQADLYFEGNDQHRGWFQSSFWLSLALQGKLPYKKVFTHGFVVDGNREKMSKSKGNVVSPLNVLKKYGAEILRYWVASTDYTKDVQVSDEILKRASDGYKKLRNTLRFLVSNMPNEKLDFKGQLFPADVWILNKSKEVLDFVHDSFSKQLYFSGIQKLSEYINSDLSGIYISSCKDRLYCSSGEHRESAVFVLSKILESILTLIAPLFTYTAQEVFGYLPDWMKDGKKDVFDLVYVPLSSVEIKFDLNVWKKILSDFHLEFDKLKTTSEIKETLEVQLEFEKEEDIFEFSSDWFGVSRVVAFSEKDFLCEFSSEGRKFKIVKSSLKKCERCWKRNAENVLCQRCEFLTQIKEKE
ncbi:MAG: class I tRNA ligase family protein, partial [bacterium]